MPKFPNNFYGVELRVHRSKLRPHVSQADLAARLLIKGLDLDRSAISRIENGERHLKDVEFQLICECLKVNPGEIVRQFQKRKSRLYKEIDEKHDLLAAEDFPDDLSDDQDRTNDEPE